MLLRILFTILIAAFAASCTRVETHAAPAVAPAVAIAKAAPDDLSRDLVLTAEFRPFQEIDVMAKVAGYVKTIHVDAGDRVQQGQVLAILEVPEMVDDRARAEAAVERSHAEVSRARDDLQRAQSTHDQTHLTYTRLQGVSKQRPGLIAQQEIDDAQSKDLVSEAQIAAAKSALAAAEQQVHVINAELRKVKTMADYTRITAPFAGVITKRFADTGSMIQAGTASNTQAMPLVRLSENSRLRLILPVPESAVPTVRIGQPVDVRVPTMNRSFPGKVARFSGRVAPATRTMDTEVDVPNPTLVLIPGMYAEVNLAMERRKSVLAIPVAAVDNGQVMVVTPENRIEIRKVETGLETASKVEVRSGLQPGDQVVIGSRGGLQQGQEVRPMVTIMGSR